jgi:hypothetical protein
MENQNVALVSKAIGEMEAVIPLLKQDLEEASDKEVRYDLEGFLVSTEVKLCIAYYTTSKESNKVKSQVINSISTFEQHFKFDNGYGDYEHMVWLVSLAILVDVELEDFKRITDVVKRDKVRDKLLNFLIKYKQSDWMDISNRFIQKSPYEKLKRAIDESSEETGLRELSHYLNKGIWYKGHSDASWYDNHKRTKVNVFFGYWSWEAAALVKAKGWSDENLKDNEYYPYNAVHW